MELQSYFFRILQDKFKLAVIVILFSLPILEVVQIAWGVYQGLSIPNPNFATFLSLYTIRHYLQRIMIWFLPLYLLVITSEDTLEDYSTGYRSILISKIGKKLYISTKLYGSFLLSFLIIFFSLIVNMILVYTCFKNGEFVKTDWQGVNYADKDLTRISIPHPIITNVIYILVTSFLAGLVGMAGTAIALIIKERKLVYGLAFLLWFIPVNLENAVTLALQPFIYLDFEIVLPTLFLVVTGYIIVIGLSIKMEVKGNEL